MASCTLCVTSPQPDGMPRESWEHFVLLVVLDECASRWKKKPSSPPPTFATISFWHKVLGAGVRVILLMEEDVEEGADDIQSHWRL